MFHKPIDLRCGTKSGLSSLSRGWRTPSGELKIKNGPSKLRLCDFERHSLCPAMLTYTIRKLQDLLIGALSRTKNVLSPTSVALGWRRKVSQLDHVSANYSSNLSLIFTHKTPPELKGISNNLVKMKAGLSLSLIAGAGLVQPRSRLSSSACANNNEC